MSNAKKSGRRGRDRADRAASAPKFPALRALVHGPSEGEHKVRYRRGKYTKFPREFHDMAEIGDFTIKLGQIITFDKLKIEYAKWVLAQTNGSKPEAAGLLEIAPRTFYNWFEDYEGGETIPGQT